MAHSVGEPIGGYWHRCPICGKEFHAGADWVYRKGYEERNKTYYCSWKCLRIFEKKTEEEKTRRKEQKQMDDMERKELLKRVEEAEKKMTEARKAAVEAQQAFEELRDKHTRLIGDIMQLMARMEHIR